MVWLLIGAARATGAWRTETLTPAGAVAPAALSFDPAGDGLLLWGGNPYALQPPRPFDGSELRAANGIWGPAPGPPFTAIEQLQVYGHGRALLIGAEAVTAKGGTPPPGSIPCCGGYPGTVSRVQVLYADGLASGGFGPVKVLDQNGSPPESATDARGDAVVAWVHAGRYRVVERVAAGQFSAPLTLPGRVLAGDPFAVALDMRGKRVLAWIERRELYARTRTTHGGWGAATQVLRLPTPARPVPTIKLSAAIAPSGRVVLAWETASGCEACATVLRAGAARQAPDGHWRAFAFERSKIPQSAPGGAVQDGLAGIIPLVDSFGRVYLVWTGGLQGAPIVKLAELTAAGIGLWTPLSDSWVGAALDDAVAGPGGALLVSWFDVSHSTSGIGSVYASLRRGSGRFALAVKLTGENITGRSGLVGFQPLTGEALVVSGVIERGSTSLRISTEAGGSPP